MRVPLRYGTQVIELSLPAERVHWTAGLSDHEASRTGDATALKAGIDGLFRGGFFDALAGRRLGLLVADATRRWAPEAVLSTLAPALGAAAEVEILVCTGTHDPASGPNRELAALLGRLVPGARVHLHDARQDPLEQLGSTPAGTPVEVSRRLASRELLLILSDVKHHYFAGYSNPIKYVVPGLASTVTTRANHAWALDPRSRAGAHPWHPDPGRRDNPLARDLLDAFELAVGERPVHALTQFTSGDVVLWCAGGEVREVTARAMLDADRVGSVRVEPARRLVVSAGGDPFDESLYTAQRALELSREAVVEGGEVLFLAACAQGIGPPSARENFYEPLCRPLDRIVAPEREDYRLYGHKPVRFAQVRRRLDRLHFSSELDPHEVRRIHMDPCVDPQSVLDRWLAEDEPVAFLEDAAKLLVTR